MSRLPQLRMSIGVAVCTTRRMNEFLGFDEIAVVCRRIRRGKRPVLAKAVIVCFGDPFLVLCGRHSIAFHEICVKAKGTVNDPHQKKYHLKESCPVSHSR